MIPMRLCVLGIRGYSGRPVREVVGMAHRALGFASELTLHYYAAHPERYPTFSLTVDQVKRYYQPDLAVTLGSMSKRPYDNSRWPERHKDSLKATGGGVFRRFDVGFGMLVSGDVVGGYECGAYGGVDKASIFVDHGHDPPFIRPAFYGKGIKDVSAVAFRGMVNYWEQHGHHENVWNRPISEFRSDSGGFTSEATAEACREFKIIQTFSTPGAQGQNPAEATIRRLFELVTTCFAYANWVPRMLWTYCLAYVCQCRNLRVTSLDQGPSWEAFHGEFYDFVTCPLLPFGQPVVVFVDKPRRSWKFGPHGIVAMYVGTPEGIKNAIMIFSPVTGRVRVTRDYMILDVDAVPKYWLRYTTKDGVFRPVQDPVHPDAAMDEEALPLMNGDPTASVQEVQVTEEDRSIAEVSVIPSAIEEVRPGAPAVMVLPPPAVMVQQDEVVVQTPVGDVVNSNLVPPVQSKTLT